MKKTILILLVSIMLLFIGGCGTSNSLLQDELIEGDVPQTQAIDPQDVNFQTNETAADMVMSKVDANQAVEAGSFIEIFNQPTFTSNSLVASNIAEQDGTFYVWITTGNKSETIYVTATAPGKRRSPSIIFNR